MFSIVIPVLTSVSPVFVFLGILVLFDSYKLLKIRSILLGISYGAVIAVIAGGANFWILNNYDFQASNYTRYVAPWIEEFLKSILIFYFIYRGKTGFLIDSAIIGFSIGAGFAFIENIYYIQTLTDPHPVIWVIRGFGTAIMHGGATAIFAILFKGYSDRKDKSYAFIQPFPGYLLAVIIHSVYNQFLFTPLGNTLGVLIILPVTFTFIFKKSENGLRVWLGTGFDNDMELLSLLNEGKMSETKAGAYLRSIRNQFDPLVVVDMIMLLKIHLELSIRAKAVLMSREAGIEVQPTEDIRDKFNELSQLEKNVGQIGLMTLSPFLNKSKRDLWELHMLDKMK